MATVEEAFPPSIEEIDNDYRASLPAFSHAPVQPVESAPEPLTEPEADQDTLADLKYAYSAMRATFRKARGATQVKIGIRLRSIGAQIRAYGVNPQYV
jgi:hypothetical protein